MNHFDKIENRIKEIIEKRATLFPWSDQHAVLIQHLCESIHNYLMDECNGITHASSGFQIYMSQSDVQLWKQQPEWQKSLENIFNETISEFGFSLDNIPELTLTTKNSLKKSEILITVNNSLDKEKTGVVNYPNPSQPVAQVNENKHSAKLLFNNNELIPLSKVVINLGRRSTNDIVINDLRISRTHAQIRKSREGYLIFDVGSSGGTFINGERITNHLLRSGDVISLAGYTMIYTDENNHELSIKKVDTSEISGISERAE
jgi:hypothetical protein